MTLYTFYGRDKTGLASVLGTLDIEKQEYNGPKAISIKSTVLKTTYELHLDPTSEEDLFRLFGRGTYFWIAKGEPHKAKEPLKERDKGMPAVATKPTLRLSRSDESNN
jgi:hypothetical protein